MDRKIKSVKLRNDYRDRTYFIPAGTELTNNNTSYWWLMKIISIHEDDIKRNITDLFEIEYESERKSITVKIEYDESQYFSRDITPEDIEYFISGSTVQYGNINVTEVTND